MTVDEIKTQIEALPQEDYLALQGWVIGAERKRREVAPAVDAGQAHLVRELREQGVVNAPPAPSDPEDPDTYPAWENPGTDHARMYLLGDRVCHQGRVWESGVDMLNSWEPGSAHTVWVDITDQITPAAEGTEQDLDEATPADPVPEQLEEDPTPEIPKWRAGLAVARGEQLLYQGTVFTVVQGHTTMDGWEPPNVPALFITG